jgi:hypothetical protein
MTRFKVLSFRHVVIGVVAFNVLLANCLAQDINDQAAIDAGQEALKSRRLPWYDSATDGLRRSELPIKQKPLQARDWSYQPPQAVAGNAWLAALWRVVQYFVWAFLAALIAFLLFLAIKSVVSMAESNRSTSENFEDEHRTEADRIESLPFRVNHQTGDLLADARRLYEAGNYADAIVYLFSYQLVQLDKSHVIRLTKGKTNRQYMSEILPRLSLRNVVGQTMLAFEDVFFGHYPLDQDRFESCWNRVDEFHRELAIQQTAKGGIG